MMKYLQIKTKNEINERRNRDKAIKEREIAENVVENAINILFILFCMYLL